MFGMKDRAALVTGAAGGVGRGVALALAEQGASVALNDLNRDGLEETARLVSEVGVDVHVAAFDLTDGDACDAGVREIEAALGGIDILVNNAGGTAGRWPTRFLETPKADWPALLGMNLDSTLHCTRAVAPGMVERGYGRIVSISSDAARVGNLGSSIYGAAKAGVEGFTRTLAKELGRKGVTVNAVVLGLIDTVPAEYLEQANAADAYVVGRVGTAADVAAAVVYLASEEASWVTGHSLVVNGGGTR